MLKLNPAASMVTAIQGSVSSSSDLLPSVSIVQIAGKAPRKLTKPKTQDAIKAPKSEKPASAKMVEEYYK
jgi:hypothetical protein